MNFLLFIFAMTSAERELHKLLLLSIHCKDTSPKNWKKIFPKKLCGLVPLLYKSDLLCSVLNTSLSVNWQGGGHSFSTNKNSPGHKVSWVKIGEKIGALHFRYEPYDTSKKTTHIEANPRISACQHNLTCHAHFTAPPPPPQMLQN
jgi:hypothetical protein